MEQGGVLSSGPAALSAEEVARRLAAAPPGRRGPPRGPAGRATGVPRGDHDLNPDLYAPGRALARAAVLVPIIARPRALTVVLTRRTEHLRMHAGQISFPGGRIAPEDRDAWAAALREAEEEIALAPARVRFAGRLDTYVTRTGFEVAPLVGLVDAPGPLAPDAREVAEVFEVPLSFFLDPANREVHSRVYEGRERFFFAFPYEAHYIWGATAGMLVNLVEILSDS